MNSKDNGYIESRSAVEEYITRLRYALDNGASLQLVRSRHSDEVKDYRHTNKFTLSDLFPNEDPAVALRRELGLLEVGNYIRTLPDTRYRHLPELREFGKAYNGKDVYIKIRVELISSGGGKSVMVLSFHYAEYKFDNDEFPYRENN